MADHSEPKTKSTKSKQPRVVFHEIDRSKEAPLDLNDPLFNPATPQNREATYFVTWPPSYPRYGLFKSLEDYDRVWPEMIYWDKRQQSEYADAIARRYSLNPKFLHAQMQSWQKSSEKAVPVEQLNGCSVGNMAFLVLMNPTNEVMQREYQKMIDALRQAFPRSAASSSTE